MPYALLKRRQAEKHEAEPGKRCPASRHAFPAQQLDQCADEDHRQRRGRE
jgi:hypothetical protein